jgi:hypothetical protein
MSAEQSYKEIQIDLTLIDKPQRAKILPSLTPPELVQAIIAEFSAVPHLTPDPAAYRLVRADTGAVLDDESPILKQLGVQAACRLVEYSSTLPPGATPMGRRAYLREQSSGRIYRLPWQPAVIGRPDEKLTTNDLLAVNLVSDSAGMVVSRRHAQIVCDGRQIFIESLGQNPTRVSSAQSPPSELSGRRPLQDGDVIELVRSQIRLQVIIPTDGPLT